MTEEQEPCGCLTVRQENGWTDHYACLQHFAGAQLEAKMNPALTVKLVIDRDAFKRAMLPLTKV